MDSVYIVIVSWKQRRKHSVAASVLQCRVTIQLRNTKKLGRKRSCWFDRSETKSDELECMES